MSRTGALWRETERLPRQPQDAAVLHSLLQSVAREIREARVLVLGTYQDLGLPRGHALLQGAPAHVASLEAPSVRHIFRHEDAY